VFPAEWPHRGGKLGKSGQGQCPQDRRTAVPGPAPGRGDMSSIGAPSAVPHAPAPAPRTAAGSSKQVSATPSAAGASSAVPRRSFYPAKAGTRKRPPTSNHVAGSRQELPVEASSSGPAPNPLLEDLVQGSRCRNSAALPGSAAFPGPAGDSRQSGCPQHEAWAVPAARVQTAMPPLNGAAAGSGHSQHSVESHPTVDETVSIGEHVLVNGLVHSPQFNGRWGVVEAYDETMQRYVVRIALANTASPDQSVLAKLRRETIFVPARPHRPPEFSTG